MLIKFLRFGLIVKEEGINLKVANREASFFISVSVLVFGCLASTDVQCSSALNEWILRIDPSELNGLAK